MAHHGTEFGADLYDLWFAGEHQLRELAIEFRRAANRLDETSRHDEAFRRPPELGGPYGPARSPYLEFRDRVYAFLTETWTNMELAGEGLSMAAVA